MENKQEICNLLCVALKAIRDQHDLTDIVYRQMSEDNEIVTLFYENGHK